MQKTILCPVCGESKSVEKVSTLYLTGIGLSGDGQSPEARPPEQMRVNRKSAAYALSRKLAPPSGSRPALTRPINPDQVVFAFSIIAPVFLYGILASQRVLLLPVMGCLLLFYGAYFWQRKRLLARFEQEQASRRAKDERVKKGIERWMRMYYCAEDEVVFEAGKKEAILLDLMAGYLLREE